MKYLTNCSSTHASTLDHIKGFHSFQTLFQRSLNKSKHNINQSTYLLNDYKTQLKDVWIYLLVDDDTEYCITNSYVTPLVIIIIVVIVREKQNIMNHYGRLLNDMIIMLLYHQNGNP